MRIAGKLLLALLVLAALLVLLLMMIALHPPLYKDLLQRQVRSSTGYELRVRKLELDLFPPHLGAEEVTLHNPEAAIDAALLRVEHVVIDGDFGALFSAPKNWWRGAVRGGELRTGQNARGRSLWATSGEAPAMEPPADEPTALPAALLRFQQIALEDFRVLRLHAAASEALDSEVLEIAELRLERDSDERLQIQLRGDYAGEALHAAGTLALPSSERARDVDFNATGFGGKVTFSGRVGHDGIVPGEARYSVAWPQLDKLSRLSGQDLSALAPLDLTGSLRTPERGSWALTAEGELGGEPLSLDSALEHEGAAYRLRRLQLQYADSRLHGSARLDSAARSAALDLEAAVLDLDQLLALAPERAGEEEQSQPALPLRQLFAWTLHLNASLQELRYGDYRLTDLDAGATSADGELQIKAAVGSVRALWPAEDAPMPTLAGDERASGSREASSRPVQWQTRQPLQAEATLALTGTAGGGRALQLSLRGAGLEAEVRTQLPAQSWLPTRGSANLSLNSLPGGHLKIPHPWPGQNPPPMAAGLG